MEFVLGGSHFLNVLLYFVLLMAYTLLVPFAWLRCTLSSFSSAQNVWTVFGTVPEGVELSTSRLTVARSATEPLGNPTDKPLDLDTDTTFPY